MKEGPPRLFDFDAITGQVTELAGQPVENNQVLTMPDLRKLRKEDPDAYKEAIAAMNHGKPASTSSKA